MRVLIKIGCCVIFCFIVSCSKYSGANKPTVLNHIVNDTSLPFSNESAVIQFYQTEGFDPVWIAKIVISKTQWGNIKNVLSNKISDRGTYQNTVTASAQWWKPANIVFEKQYIEVDRLIHVYVSEENGFIILYIECIT